MTARAFGARLVLCVAVGLLLSASGTGVARADTFFVSTPFELRDAITAAAATDGPDTIVLSAGVFDIGNTISTVELRAFDLAVPSGHNGITLVGAGPGMTILDGDGAFGRVVDVAGSSPMTIRNMTIRNGGDGVDAFQQGVTLTDVVVRDNAGNAFSGGDLTITDSTVTNNAEGIDVECGIIATNTTIAANAGTGLHVDCTDQGSRLLNLTIVHNGLGVDFTESIPVDNTIIADNAGGDCAVSLFKDPTGTHDLIGAGTCGSALTGVVTGDPQLGPLQDNGGPTPTMAPAASSPAVDAGGDSVCPAADQRGVARPAGPHCDIGAVEIAVAANNAPSCSDYSGSVTAGGTLSDSVACSDPDPADSITIAGLAGPSHGTLSLHPDGSFTYTPDSGYSGSDSFTFQATDSHGALTPPATASITVTPPNRPPTCSDYTGSVATGSALNDTVACTDPDPGDSITIAAVAAPSHGTLTLHPDGSFTYTPDSGYSGSDSFTFQATDSHGAVSTVATGQVDISTPPVCYDMTLRLLANGFSDGSGLCGASTQSVTVVVDSQPAHGTLTLGSGGYYKYTPDAGYTGDDSFTFHAVNADGIPSGTATAWITVVRPPACYSSGFFSAVGTQLSGNVDCQAGSVPTFRILLAAGGEPSHGTLTLNPDGSFTYTPDPGFTGDDSFTYYAVDSLGFYSAVTGTAYISVAGQAVCNDAVLELRVNGSTNGTLPCFDTGHNAVLVGLITQPAHGTLTLNRDGSFTYTPDSGYSGSDSFTYQAWFPGDLPSRTATAFITVVRPPTCSDVNFVAVEGAALSGNADCQAGSVPTFTVGLAAGTAPSHGTLALNADGSFTYTPDAGYTGSDSFRYYAVDSLGFYSAAGVADLATATFTVVNTGTGSNVAVQPAPGLGVTFASVTSPGETTASGSLTGPAAPAGFAIPGGSTSYDVTTTATYSGPVEVCLPIPFGVSFPRLLHYVNGVGVDVTTRTTPTQVCGNVSSLSPFVVAVRLIPSALTYTGSASLTFGPVPLSARLTDPATGAGLGDRAVTFTIDGGAAIPATTATDGTVSVMTRLPLAPGAHAVAIAFAGDTVYLASNAQATIHVVNSAHGSVHAAGVRPAVGGKVDLEARVDPTGRLQGHLHYDDRPGRAQAFHADTIAAFGIGADGTSAWISGSDGDGHTFLAFVRDNGGHGDRLVLWIDGTLVTGDGTLRAGAVRVDPLH